MKEIFKVGPRFIVFEGIEACGKSTQAQKLADYLVSKGERVWLTCEPTKEPTGKLLRYYLQHPDDKVSNLTFAFMFAADRDVHLNQIMEHLANGEWVICDRYIYSTLAYQCHGSYANLIKSMNSSFIYPNFTFYVDLPVDEAMKRIKSRAGVEECFDKENVLKDIQARYNELFTNYEYGHLYHINGNQNIEDVFKEIKNAADSESFHETSSSILRVLRR